MSSVNKSLNLPEYQTFVDSISILALPFSASELHGVMCGYLSAGAINEGEAYLRALIANKNDSGLRRAALALFGVYAISQQQLGSFDFEFQLLLPDDEESLATRAQAFCEWCEGFTQGITLAGVRYEQLHEEDAQDALVHMTEFGQLDYEGLQIDEEDEQALMEVTEYARMAVMHIFSDLHDPNNLQNGPTEVTH